MSAQFLQFLDDEYANLKLKDEKDKAIEDLKSAFKQRFEQIITRIKRYKNEIKTNNSYPTKSPFGSQESEHLLKEELANENTQNEHRLKIAYDIYRKLKECLQCIKEISKTHTISGEQYSLLYDFATERANLAASYHQDSLLAIQIDKFLALMQIKRRKLNPQTKESSSKEASKDAAESMHSKTNPKNTSENLSESQKKPVKPFVPKFGQFLEPPKPNSLHASKKSRKRKFEPC